ncbi:MAG: hypothetical protein V7K67_26025 [Nostoc sp.]|uniref:hypothetical protein n=1 Tax=Nostoc sp. TaxID=1180 RepID=UPI002FFC74EA
MSITKLEARLAIAQQLSEIPDFLKKSGKLKDWVRSLFGNSRMNKCDRYLEIAE